MKVCVLPALICTSCSNGPATMDAGDGAIDASEGDATEAGLAGCSEAMPFSTPQQIVSIGQARNASISADELRAYFMEPLGDLMMIERASIDATFGPPKAVLTGVGNNIGYAWVTPDEKRAYLMSGLMTPYPYRLYERPDAKSQFGGYSSPSIELFDLRLGFDGNGYGEVTMGGRTNVASADSADGRTFGPATILNGLMSSYSDSAPLVTANGVAVYFTSGRSGQADIYLSTRSSTNAAWEAPASVAELNSADVDIPVAITRDACRIYVLRADPTKSRLLVATRNP